MKAFVALVAMSLCACVATANSVRVAQTKSAKGWFCKSEPIVDCRGGCSSESTVWRAYCGNKRYDCRFDEPHGDGTRITNTADDQPVFRSVSCRPEQ